jgi:beta-phosphoglucomutase-like phosphatase (HAD superfamily)
MTDRPVLFDVDWVLLDWLSAFRPWAESHLGRPVIGSPQQYDCVDWLGLSQDDVFTAISTFAASPAFGAMAPLPGAVTAVQALQSAGHPLVAITSCGATPAIQATRRANLRDVFGDAFMAVHVLGLGACKADMLARYPAGCAWIEDQPHHALTGLQAGHRPFIIRQCHNRTLEAGCHPAITWLDQVDDVLGRLFQPAAPVPDGHAA